MELEVDYDKNVGFEILLLGIEWLNVSLRKKERADLFSVLSWHERNAKQFIAQY